VPKIVDAILRNKTNGFFIESGAYDGEGLTNTLLFEKASSSNDEGTHTKLFCLKKQLFSLRDTAI
jgi:hypothetical protein